MTGETDLTTLVRSMRPTLRPGVFVFATLLEPEAIPAGLSPLMTFREVEGLTLILPRETAESAGLKATFPCRMISLGVHSSLDAVGFLAAVAAKLAAAGIPANPVAAFHHDHLFVPVERAEAAMRILQHLAGNPDSSSDFPE
jgi:hypothetical protein